MTPDEQNIRLSHADRESAIARLQKALDEGRLDIGEFDERTRDVYAVKTVGELQRLFDDLPDESRALDPSVHSIDLTPEEVAQREAAKNSSENCSDDKGIWIAFVWVTCITVGIWGISSIASLQLQSFWPIWPVGIMGVIAVAITIMSKLDPDD
ncbi:DUF1707 SHOCT-like domain-containing protein [Natronoglycomyces albus]|uniref:DUF1707 domain-containing protein n=1 Tax=Natronoglycomyces albus TaxID=2811108 RepID=A0A895XSA6_9ACTN|nr:DUF1707 domain-containing protein [Natronoglycomyces albus]QSB04518.1 DUF1707 domain-containing protein [Natronoglycomyces albus]